jgi:hypothetical protein
MSRPGQNESAKGVADGQPGQSFVRRRGLYREVNKQIEATGKGCWLRYRERTADARLKRFSHRCSTGCNDDTRGHPLLPLPAHRGRRKRCGSGLQVER